MRQQYSQTWRLGKLEALVGRMVRCGSGVSEGMAGSYHACCGFCKPQATIIR